MSTTQIAFWASITTILTLSLGPPLWRTLHHRPFPAPIAGQTSRWALEARLPGGTDPRSLLMWAEVLGDLPGIQRVGRAALTSGYMEVAVFVQTRACTGQIAERWLQRELERRGYLVDAIRSRPA